MQQQMSIEQVRAVLEMQIKMKESALAMIKRELALCSEEHALNSLEIDGMENDKFAMQRYKVNELSITIKQDKLRIAQALEEQALIQSKEQLKQLSSPIVNPNLMGVKM